MKKISITPADRDSVQRVNGPTFKTRRGGFLVCNQLPGLGRLTQSQAETLRRQIWPKHKVRGLSPAEKKEKIPEVNLDYTGGLECPYCHQRKRYANVGKQKCEFCKKPMKVKPPVVVREPSRSIYGELSRHHIW